MVKFRPWAIALIFSAALCVLTIVVLLASPLAGNLVDSQAENFLDQQLETFLSPLNLEFSYESISPAFLGNVLVKNIHLKIMDGFSIEIPRVRVRYSLMALFNRDFSSAVQKLTLYNPEFLINIDQISLQEILSDESASPLTSLTTFFNDNANPLSAAVHNAVVRIIGEQVMNMDIRVRYLELMLSSDQVVYKGDGRIWSDFASNIPELRFLSGVFLLNGAAALDQLSASARVRLMASTNIASVPQAEVNVKIDQEGLSLQLQPRNNLQRLDMYLNFKDEYILASSEFKRFRPDSLLALMPAYSFLDTWSHTEYSGSVLLKTTWDRSIPMADQLSFDAILSCTLPMTIPGGRTAFRASIAGSVRTIRIRELVLSNSLYSASYRGMVQPLSWGADGVMSITYSPPDQPSSSAKFEMFADSGSALLYADEVQLFSGKLNNLAVSLLLENEELSFQAEALLPALGSRPDLQQTSLAGISEGSSPAYQPVFSAEGSIQLGADPYLSARLSFDQFAPFIFLENTAWLGSLDPLLVSVLSRVQIASDLSLFSDLEAISYSTSNTVIALEGFNSVYAVFALTGTSQQLNISAINASLGSYAVTGRAGLSFRPNAPLAVDVEIAVNDIPYALNATIVDNSVFLSGDYGLFVRLQTFDDTTSLMFRAENLPVEVGNRVFGINAVLDGFYTSSTQWSVEIQDLILDFPPIFGQDPARLQLVGALNQDGASLHQVDIVSNSPLLTGRFDAEWAIFDGFTTTVSAFLSSAANEEYELSGTYQAGTIDARIRTQGMLMYRFSADLPFVLDSTLALQGPWFNPAAQVDFNINPDPARGGSNIIASGTANYTEGLITVQDTALDIIPLHVENASATLDLLSGKAAYNFMASVILPIGNSANGIYSALNGNVAIGQSQADAGSSSAVAAWDRKDLRSIISRLSTLDFSTMLIQGRAAEFAVKDVSYPDWPYLIDISPAGMLLRAGSNNQADFALEPTGNIRLMLAQELPLSVSASGTVKDNILDLSLRDILVDLPFLFDFLEIPIISVPSGIASGNLELSGALNDPNFEGSFDFADFYLRVDSYLADTIGPITEPLYISGNTVEFLQTDIKCGDASLSANFGFELDPWVPANIHVEAKTNNLSLIHARTGILGMNFDVLASAALAVRIGDTETEMSGWINAASGEAIITLDTLAAGQTGSEDIAVLNEIPSNIVVNLDFAIGKNVRVFFPSKFPQIFSGQSDPASRLSVYYNSAAEELALKGTVLLRGGDVFYLKRNFYLKNATLVFNETQDSFNPLLSAEAETRSSNEGRPVTITLRADDIPLRNLTFELSSTPPLSDIEIARLLGQNLMASSSERDFDIGRAIVENADLIPQLNFVSIFEQNVQNFLGLDLFYLRTQLLQRWLYDLSRLGPVDEPMSLAEYLDNTAIIAGVYLADDLFLQSTLLLQEGQLEQQGNLQLNYELNLEWQTPHFLINWSWKPEHPEKLFISDQSLSLYWRIPLK